MLQALNGFLLILTCDGEVFFATHSIESYLGFHQVRNTHFVESICLVFVKILYSVIFNVYLHSQLVGQSRQECQFRSTCHVYASSPLLTQHHVFRIFPRLSNLVNVPIVSSNYRVGDESKFETWKILPMDFYSIVKTIISIRWINANVSFRDDHLFDFGIISNLYFE